LNLHGKFLSLQNRRSSAIRLISVCNDYRPVQGIGMRNRGGDGRNRLLTQAKGRKRGITAVQDYDAPRAPDI